MGSGGAEAGLKLATPRRGFIGCLVTAFPLCAAATPEQTLKSVALEYQSAIDYYLQVQTRSRSGGTEGAQLFDYVLAASLPRLFFMRQKARSHDPFELQIVVNEASTIGYLPRRNRYTMTTDQHDAAREELDAVHERFFGRFRLLGRLRAEARLRGSGTVRSGGLSIRCARIQLTSADTSWTEELWIDVERRRILKSVYRRKLPFPETGDMTTTSIWTVCRLKESPDPALFKFAPPPSAQRTNTLEFR